MENCGGRIWEFWKARKTGRREDAVCCFQGGHSCGHPKTRAVERMKLNGYFVAIVVISPRCSMDMDYQSMDNE